jgi:hypothetical protein
MDGYWLLTYYYRLLTADCCIFFVCLGIVIELCASVFLLFGEGCRIFLEALFIIFFLYV